MEEGRIVAGYERVEFPRDRNEAEEVLEELNFRQVHIFWWDVESVSEKCHKGGLNVYRNYNSEGERKEFKCEIVSSVDFEQIKEIGAEWIIRQGIAGKVYVETRH